MGLIFALFNVASSRDMPFHQLQHFGMGLDWSDSEDIFGISYAYPILTNSQLVGFWVINYSLEIPSLYIALPYYMIIIITYDIITGTMKCKTLGDNAGPIRIA